MEKPAVVCRGLRAAPTVSMGKHDALVRLKKRFLDSEDLVESEANKRNIFLSDPRNN